ncbi:MAG: DUF5652 family protein [Candidatus Microsaccharimonas sp.]
METLTTPQIIFVILIAIWTLFWKGLALWHAARKKNQVWFVVLLLINTVGILEIVYLFFVAKVKPRKLLS